ncbi:MAG: recombination mediator RecR [Candidatus Ancillula sp.]|jgi:recombination protein RecR|nr:recombination mediator RecR [Candidatus Ancillula sp.]
MFEEVVQDLIDQLGRFPGVGPKSAQRMALWLINQPDTTATEISRTIIDSKRKAKFCKICGNISEEEICSICSNPNRDRTLIAVVEDSKDLVAIEKTREFRGLYQVLGGSLNPIEGIYPEDLRIRDLVMRLGDGKVKEVIIATNPNIEGEATASYLARLIAPLGVKVSRIATGLPMGSDLEFADQMTLGKAFEARTEVKVEE